MSPSSRPQLDRVGRVGDRRRQVEQLEDPLDPGPRLLADREQPGELAGRRDELPDVGGEGEEGAEADLAAQGQPAAEGEDRHLAERRDRLQQRLVARGQPDRPHLRAVEVLGGRGDPFELAPLLAERLHHADAVDRLVDDLDHLAFALLGVPGGGEDPRPHPVGDGEQEGRDDQADQRQRRREPQHHAERQHQQEEVAAHHRDEHQEALDQGGVGAGAGDELPGRHPVEGGEVHVLEVRLHLVAEVVLDAERDLAAAVAAQVGGEEGARADDHERDQPGQERFGAFDDHPVDDLALEQRRAGLAGGAEHRGAEGDRDVATAAEDVAEEAAQPALGRSLAHFLLRSARRRARRSSAISSSASPS